MGSNRSYDFVTGFETSTAPTASTPSADSDIMNKGYADAQYAGRAYWGNSVADTAALKAIGTTGANARADTQVRMKDDNQTLWKFDASSTATEDGTTVIQPTTGTGRWLSASGGGGGSSGTASASELLQTQNEIAGYGLTTRALDNSVRASGLEIPAHTYFTGNLIENYTSGGSTAKVVWNPVVVFDSDKDYDSITGWSAIDQASTLAATAGSTKVGANHFSFNKGGSGVSASIRHSLAAQTLSVGANFRVYFFVDMSSVVNLTNIFVKIMGAATTDFSKWDLTTNSAGGAIATGYNLMFVDIKNTAASSTGGTAWTTSQLARYVEVGVTTSSGAQTYTGIKFAGLWFSHGEIAQWAPKYLEFTVADTSNKSDFKIDSTTTSQDGIVTLAATVGTSYTAGVAAAARAIWYRSSLSWSQAGLIGYNTALSSGSIATEQELRLTKVIRESLSGNYGAYIDMYTPQIYRVTAVGGSTIGVEDSENHSANLVNTNQIHIFTTTYSAGEPHFTLLGTRTITGSSHSAGTTTITVSPSGIAVGDYVVKQHLSVLSSVVSATANENFSAMSYDTSPNGAQLIGSRSYPLQNSVYAHWWLGGPSETLALRDQTGNGRSLVKVGSPNLADTFRSGKFSYSGPTSSNYIRTAGGTAPEYDGRNEQIQFSIWVFNDGATTGSDRTIMADFNVNGGQSQMWILSIPSGTSTVRLRFHQNSTITSTTTTGSMVTGWNHVVFQIEQSVTHRMFLNGTLTSTTAGSMDNPNTSQALYFGINNSDTGLDLTLVNPATNVKLAECIAWRNGALLSQSDVNYLYNSGTPQWIGYNPAVLRNEYAVTGQSGQRISLEAKLNRTTTAVSPYILNAGMIKTG